MDARFICVPLIVASSVVASAAGYRTQHFLVTAPSSRLAKQIGNEAERLRHDLAMEWTGQTLRSWDRPCEIMVYTGPQMAARGETKYVPLRDRVADFRMKIWGTEERLLDSVLPHEVTHTVLATHFERPLPRWADEGACTTVEADSERMQHERMLRQFLTQDRGISVNRLFMMRDYPQDILPLYAQGYSISRFLIHQGGRQKFVQFIEDYFSKIDRHPVPDSQWTDVVRNHYGYSSLEDLQKRWLAWVREGSGSVDRFAGAPRSQVPTGRIASASTGSSAIRQASATDDSWYARRRQQTAAREGTSNSSPAVRALQPSQPNNRAVPSQGETIWR